MELRRTADGSATLFNPDYGQTFHSVHGAITEARHVFLEGSGVGERLRKGYRTSVLEVGFGTGLNFLVTADLARAYRAPLRYVALERSLPNRDVLVGLNYGRHLKGSELWEQFLAYRDSLDLHPPDAKAGFSGLELKLGDATAAKLQSGKFETIYLDGFSADTNPELWSEPFLATLVRTLKTNGTLVSFSVKGDVRRSLSSMGLKVTRKPGPPGGKREMLWSQKLG
jgi:tRNA U34 5-methylaminomethyl-2-thiouridine-forming methyltransferase MnmC